MGFFVFWVDLTSDIQVKVYFLKRCLFLNCLWNFLIDTNAWMDASPDQTVKI